MATIEEELDDLRKQIEDAYLLDLVAIERLRSRLLAAPGSPAQPSTVEALVSIGNKVRSHRGFSTTQTPLPEIVLSILHQNPTAPFTCRDLMRQIQAKGILRPGDERGSLNSISHALRRLIDFGHVQIVRRGVGRFPNHYRMTEPELAVRDHTTKLRLSNGAAA